MLYMRGIERTFEVSSQSIHLEQASTVCFYALACSSLLPILYIYLYDVALYVAALR